MENHGRIVEAAEHLSVSIVIFISDGFYKLGETEKIIKII